MRCSKDGRGLESAVAQNLMPNEGGGGGGERGFRGYQNASRWARKHPINRTADLCAAWASLRGRF